jgi:hypothetical protein
MCCMHTSEYLSAYVLMCLCAYVLMCLPLSVALVLRLVIVLIVEVAPLHELALLDVFITTVVVVLGRRAVVGCGYKYLAVVYLIFCLVVARVGLLDAHLVGLIRSCYMCRV